MCGAFSLLLLTLLLFSLKLCDTGFKPAPRLQQRQNVSQRLYLYEQILTFKKRRRKEGTTHQAHFLLPSWQTIYSVPFIDVLANTT